MSDDNMLDIFVALVTVMVFAMWITLAIIEVNS